MLPEGLNDLAQAYGVATEFWDWQGRHRPVTVETVRAVLDALGVQAHDDAQTAGALADVRDAPWRDIAPPFVVAAAGQVPHLPVHAGAGESVKASLRTENGEVRALTLLEAEQGEPPTRTVDGMVVTRHTLDLPTDLPLGWHSVEIVCESKDRPSRSACTTYVVYPKRLGLPAGLAGSGEQQWGLMTQLYAMRSSQSWGIGDLADLADAGAWAAGLGADFVLVNPLHAGEPEAPLEPSPYLPTTRRFVSPLYIRVEDVAEVAYLSAAERQLVEWHADDAKAFLELDHLERDAVWRAKEAALRMVFRQPRSLRRDRAFEAFCERGGRSLLDFASWCALGVQHGPAWNTWPEELQDPASPAVEAFRSERATDVQFWCWLQWILAEQLAGVQRDLVDTGMRVGVVHDLAVGVHPLGADAWALRHTLARGVTVGAPPDQYNQRGQDWSQPPWQPAALAEAGYEPYREMIAGVLRDAGGLRVDHVIGLFRLWWIPAGLPADQGTYVRYDHEAMVGILMLEAHRAGAVVIGEDLGTVEPWVRDYLRERGILGTSILWFERDEHGPLPPEKYRELCLATVTTHDLPPTAGYLAGVHMELRRDLDLLTRPWAEELAEDEGARAEVLAQLRERGLLREDAPISEQVEALHRYLTWSPAKLIGVSVSDLARDVRIINQPGTHEEYPNWQVPLAGPDGRPLLLEELVDLRSAVRLARTVSRRS
ncbi:MAG: 4-alpha-glucanotransferase [Ornithinimicrobium sp.]